MLPPAAPASPVKKLAADDDDTARSLLVMHSSPARGNTSHLSPQRPRRASFATEVAHMLVSPTKYSDVHHGGQLGDSVEWQERFEEAVQGAASILSEMSPISTPIKKDPKQRRTPGGYRNKLSTAYSPFANFASNQLSPLMSMSNGTDLNALHSSFPVNLQQWDYSVGATPSPMRAAIANGASSLLGNLMSPAPGSIGSIRGQKMGGRTFKQFCCSLFFAVFCLLFYCTALFGCCYRWRPSSALNSVTVT
jgi:hypothetical protein